MDFNSQFKNYMEFVYKYKQFPKNNPNDEYERKLFIWSKNIRTLYTKNKLESDKVDLLNNFKFWYFSSKEKNKKLKLLNDFFYNIDEFQQFEIKQNKLSNDDHVIIDITNIDYYNNDNHIIVYNSNTSFLSNLFYKITSWIPKVNKNSDSIV